MAVASDIAAVRGNTNEPADAPPFTDEYIGLLIDASGVAGASATIWKRKAATFASSVDVTEAGATHKNSDIHKNMLALATVYEKEASASIVAATDRPIVRQIVR